ncbi:hypothetical protein HZB94_03795 [Candidatus Falkowbacteria bacterium]|nr:hypothetical protein [Candidatus Falkowbacteria bacterium]
MDAFIDGKRINLNPRNTLGIGGEAQVFSCAGKAIKIFHEADPSLNRRELALWRQMRQIKIAKLQKFPAGLPAGVIAPEKLVYDGQGEIIGYAMEAITGAEALFMLSNQSFRRAGVGHEEVLEIFRNLFKLQNGVHANNVIIGDFNDLNVLFKGKNAYLIDVDSMQFSGLPCVVATERFLDPRFYGKDFSASPIFDRESDYYAFAVMLFQSLLFVHPYGGIHRDYRTLLRRAEAKISVFSDEVRYPKAAVHFQVLSDELLDYFQKVFDKGERNAMSFRLLENVRWTTCSSCGLTHARSVCPLCAVAGPAIKEAIIIRGACKATRVFRAGGRIIFATTQAGKLRVLYQEGNSVCRENGERVLLEKATHDLRFSIMGESTLVGKADKVAIIRNEKVEKVIDTGRLGNSPVFDSNAADYFTLSGDYLAKNNEKIIGQILPNQTWIKVGPAFGFGFYRIGRKTVYFIFDTERGALDDTIRWPAISGKLIDADCLFTESHALFLVSREENGKILNAMYLMEKGGALIGSAEAEADNSRMLKSIRGKALHGTNVLCATDDDLMLLAVERGKFIESKIFSDTEPFVDENSQIIPASDGIYVVGESEIYLLRMSR